MFFSDMSLEDLRKIVTVTFEPAYALMTIICRGKTMGCQEPVLFSHTDNKIMVDGNMMFELVIPLLQKATGMNVSHEKRREPPHLLHIWRFSPKDDSDQALS